MKRKRVSHGFTFALFILNVTGLFGQMPGRLESVLPKQNALHVSTTATLTAVFSTAMDTATINKRTFIVRGEDSGPVSGAVSYNANSNTALFEPAIKFFAGEVVTVTLTCSLRTAQEEPFAGFTWQFTVEAFQATPPVFAEGENVRLPSRQNELYTVDLDKDGDLDIVAGQRLTREPLTVIKNDGKGRFSQLENYELSYDAQSVYGNDFDNDGDVDLVVMTALTAGHIAIFLNDGNGLFPAMRRFKDATDEAFVPVRVRDGDIDNDGNVDLIYISGGRDSAVGLVGLMKNDGSASFTETNQIRLRNEPERIALADLNNDGWLDIVVGMLVTVSQIELWSGMGVLINNGDGTFAEPEYYTFLLATDSFYCNDFDGDQDIDIAVAMNPEGLLIYLNDGSGAFPDSVDLRDRDSIFNVWGTDFDGDGDVDLLETEDPRYPDIVLTAVRLYLNPGNGRFSRAEAKELKASDTNRGYGRRPDGGDLDGDGDIDLIVPFDSSGSWLSFFFNQAEPLSVEGGDANSPDDFALEQNFPNPFNPETNIVFTLPAKGRVKVAIYNVRGQKIRTLVDREMPAGRRLLRWDGRNAGGTEVVSGVYFYKLEFFQGGLKTGLKQFTESRKMLLLR